ncbi:MAG: ribosomal-processing cysteine protease Prp, partial [Clostridia bacterium]|nr:ribosomal-processing cysteine protease Prp [Clostridia bacterium]
MIEVDYGRTDDGEYSFLCSGHAEGPDSVRLCAAVSALCITLCAAVGELTERGCAEITDMTVEDGLCSVELRADGAD